MNKYLYIGGAALVVIAGCAFTVIRWDGVGGAIGFMQSEFQSGSYSQESADQSLLASDDDQIGLSGSDTEPYDDTEAVASSAIAATPALKIEKKSSATSKVMPDITRAVIQSASDASNGDS